MPNVKAGKTPTVLDALEECLQLLTQAKLAPDAQAHGQIIQALEQGIVQYIQMVRQKSIASAVQGGGQPGQPGQAGGGPPMGGGMPPAGGGNPGGQPMQIQPGGGGGMSGFGTPNPDELRRTLAGPAAVKG